MSLIWIDGGFVSRLFKFVFYNRIIFLIVYYILLGWRKICGIVFEMILVIVLNKND